MLLPCIGVFLLYALAYYRFLNKEILLEHGVLSRVKACTEGDLAEEFGFYVEIWHQTSYTALAFGSVIGQLFEMRFCNLTHGNKTWNEWQCPCNISTRYLISFAIFHFSESAMDTMLAPGV